MQRILVVEDEMQIARTLRDYLEVAGYDVTVVGDGGAALASARGERPDLVVLDLGLPTIDGLDVARELRRTASTPIVSFSCRLNARELACLIAWPLEGPQIPGLGLGGSRDLLPDPAIPRIGRVIGGGIAGLVASIAAAARTNGTAT